MSYEEDENEKDVLSRPFHRPYLRPPNASKVKCPSIKSYIIQILCVCVLNNMFFYLIIMYFYIIMVYFYIIIMQFNNVFNILWTTFLGTFLGRIT